jgi:hypothetical protein
MIEMAPCPRSILPPLRRPRSRQRRRSKPPCAAPRLTSGCRSTSWRPAQGGPRKPAPLTRRRCSTWCFDCEETESSRSIGRIATSPTALRRSSFDRRVEQRALRPEARSGPLTDASEDGGRDGVRVHRPPRSTGLTSSRSKQRVRGDVRWPVPRRQTKEYGYAREQGAPWSACTELLARALTTRRRGRARAHSLV